MSLYKHGAWFVWYVLDDSSVVVAYNIVFVVPLLANSKMITMIIQMYFFHHLPGDWFYLWIGTWWMHWLRRRLLYRKSQGTLISQLREKQAT